MRATLLVTLSVALFAMGLGMATAPASASICIGPSHICLGGGGGGCDGDVCNPCDPTPGIPPRGC